MSASVQVECPTCHGDVAASSVFCVRCGSALPAVTVLGAVAEPDQRWGGGRRRDRSGRTGRAANRSAEPTQPAPVPMPQVGEQSGGASGRRRNLSRIPAAALGPAFDRVTPAVQGRRVGAYGIDLLVVTALGGLIGLLTQSVVAAGLAAIELAVGLAVWEARSGRTIGNEILGLRAARVETPYAPGLRRAAGRAAVLAAGHLVLGVGQWLVVASTAFDRSGRAQGWHDQLGRVVVVDVRALRKAEAVAADAEAEAMATASVESARVATGAAPVRLTHSPPGPIAPVAAIDPIVAIIPGPEVQLEPARARVAASAYVLTLDSGQEIDVSGPGYIGRRPQAPAGTSCDHLIAIEDEGRSLSRTHAGFGIDATGFWVQDRGSGNGTYVLSADGSFVQVLEGERVTVPRGGTVRMGERTFTVVAVR